MKFLNPFKKPHLLIFVVAILILPSCSITKQQPSHISSSDSIQNLTTLDAAKKLKWEIAAMVGGATYLGVENWNWGSRKSFKTSNEGWFSTDTNSAGADKLGHMYSSYLINELFNKRLLKKTNNVKEAAKKSALFSSGVMLWVELFDGYSDDHGFSYEDLTFNTAGIGLSYLKNTIPSIDKKLDFRVEYHPTHNSNHPVIDYSGYTYKFVTKLNGFNRFKKTPLKYFELQLGYHTQGFKKHDEYHFKDKKAEVSFGIGINLSEVLFKPMKKHTNSAIVDWGDTFFKYYQAPGIYAETPINTRRVSF